MRNSGGNEADILETHRGDDHVQNRVGGPRDAPHQEPVRVLKGKAGYSPQRPKEVDTPRQVKQEMKIWRGEAKSCRRK